ncbi:hypothetical protein FJZ18_01285 [Candidatus Pacearchaeota archaeon]|nr:hypothetical protein [Candidatus Pacearchaeota archaeon]
MEGFIKSLRAAVFNMEETKTRFNDGRAQDRFLDRCIQQKVPLKIDLTKIPELILHKHFHFVDYIGLSSWYCQA